MLSGHHVSRHRAHFFSAFPIFLGVVSIAGHVSTDPARLFDFSGEQIPTCSYVFVEFAELGTHQLSACVSLARCHPAMSYTLGIGELQPFFGVELVHGIIPSLDLVLGLRLLNRLPLHVVRRVGTAALERGHMARVQGCLSPHRVRTVTRRKKEGPRGEGSLEAS